jgi:hypothetical protein
MESVTCRNSSSSNFLVKNESHLPQWHWIVATVTALRNHNAELGMIRLETLAWRVWTLVRHDKEEMRKFQGPNNLGNGKL